MEHAIEQFEQYLKSRYPNSTTARHYKHDLQQFNQLIRKPPRAVTREDVDQLVEDQLARGLAATTINRRLAALHEFFEYLADKTGDAKWPNPVNWKRHKVKAGKPLPRDVSDADVERLFTQITHPRDKAMFRLMLDVGLRVGEVAALRKGDLMLENDGLPGRLRVRGKGGKERFVWLLPETVAVMQAWLEQRPAVNDKALFITRRKKGFSVRGIEERLTYYCRQAGVQVSPHQLRHTFGRRMAEAEMPVTSLAALMGHAQVTTTQIYIAGAGVEIQTHYQAAMARLDHSTADDGKERLLSGAETVDVWELADVTPVSATVRQSAVEEQMDLSRYWEGLSDWLTKLLQEHIAYRQRRWKPSQVRHHTRTRLSALRRVWRWFLDKEQIDSIADLQREHVQRYMDARLRAGMRSGTVNADLADLWAFLSYLEDRGHPVCASVFRVKRPRREDSLPRFLSESDFRKLDSVVLQAAKSGQRDGLLDRACFCLLSEAGLRLSEVCDLRLGDVDLSAQRLIVRAGKKNRDRSVPLSPALHTALKTYLPVRGEAQTDHLLIYRGQAAKYDLIRGRLRRYGKQVEVEVSPHRLRHTLATRLLNAGMPITSIQRLLGHEKLETTMIYARVHNETVRRDYESAHARLAPPPPLADQLFNAPTRTVELQPITDEGDCV